MDRSTFDRMVKEAVDHGADAKEAASYIIAGHKIPTDKAGKPVFEKAAAGVSSPHSKGSTSKKTTRKRS